MSRTGDYNGNVDLINGLRRKNNGDFFLVDSPDVRTGDGISLKDSLEDIADVKTDLRQIETDSTYQIFPTFESGNVNASGEVTDNEDYSRTVDYISTEDVNYITTVGAGFNVRYFDVEDDSYVFKASGWCAAGSSYNINKSYACFRAAGKVTIGNHPEDKCLFYAPIALKHEVDGIKSRETGRYKAPVYMTNGWVPTWTQTNSNATLTLAHDISVVFEGFSSATYVIPTNSIYDAANASELTTVTGDNISGSNFAIIYNIKTQTLSITEAGGYRYADPDEVVLFTAYFGSFVSGLIVDYVNAKSHEKRIKAIETNMSTAQTDISGLQSDMTAAEGNIEALQSDMTAAEGNIEALQEHEKNLYNAKAFVVSGKECSWKFIKSVSNPNFLDTHLYIGGNVNFTGYTGGVNSIALTDILAAANTATGVTVTDGVISGISYSIYYSISEELVKVTSSATFKPGANEKLLFRAYYGYYAIGELAEYAVETGWMPQKNWLSGINNNLILPPYWMTYLESKIHDVQGKDCLIGNHGDSFVFCTDQHYPTNAGNSPAAINYVLLNSSVNTLIMGGDLMHGDKNSKTSALNCLIDVRNRYKIFNPKYLRGNHDSNTEVQTPLGQDYGAIEDSEFYGTLIKPIENEIHADGQLYYYYDNPAQKIRYFCLDTKHPNREEDSDLYRVDSVQLQWLKDKITELSAGWTVVIFSHQFLKMANGIPTEDVNGTAVRNGVYEPVDPDHPDA